MTTSTSNQFTRSQELSDEDIPASGNHVLVRFPTKTKVVFYVGQIDNCISKDEYVTKFLRWSKTGFSFPARDDVAEISRKEIASKLPKPQTVFGSSRLSAYSKFPINLSSYTIK